MTRDQRGDVELTRAVEAEIRLRHILAQKPIGAHDLGRAARRRRRMVKDDQMVANPIEGAYVAPDQPRGLVGDRPSLFKKNTITQPLRPADFLLRRRQAKLQRSNRAETRPKTAQIANSAPDARKRPSDAARTFDRPQCHQTLSDSQIMQPSEHLRLNQL